MSFCLKPVNKINSEFIIKYLIEHEVVINKENLYGETPLFYECKSGNINLVNCLIEHNADMNKKK